MLLIPMHIIIASVVDSPQLVSPFKATLLKSRPNEMVAVHSKPLLIRKAQMMFHKEVRLRDDEKHKHNCQGTNANTEQA